MNTEQALDALVEGIHSQTEMVWDGLGIQVSLPSLPSWQEYAQLRNWLYPEYRIILQIRRTLAPRKYKRTWKRYLEVQLQVQAEFLNAVLKQGEEKIEQ